MTPSAPVRVLYCIDALSRGGTELQLIHLIRNLDRSRVEPCLLTLRPYDTRAHAVDCEHLEWDVPRILAPGAWKEMRRLAGWMRRTNVRAIHTFFQDSTVFAGTAARMAGVPLRVAGFRDMGFWRTRGQDLLMRGAYRLMNRYVANSEAVRDRFLRDFALDPNRFQVIYNGVDVDRLPWIEHEGPTLHIGIVGNLNRPVKRTDLFLRAAGRAAVRHRDVTWHILGEGNLRPGLESLAAEVGLGDRVVFAGSVSDVPAYLEKLQAAVICSDSEGLSNALLEYLFKGCAAVATDVGGNPELVRHEQTGLLVPPDDEVALAGALERLIEDPQLRRTLARAARRFAEESFSWERCEQEHSTLYCSLVDS